MVLRDSSIKPQSVAHHIGIGDRTDALGSTDIHIATDYHRGQTLRGLLHHPFIERQLKVEQGLRQSLATLPTEHGDRGQYLTTGGIGGQSATLSTGM